jgi:hypothetical protein
MQRENLLATNFLACVTFSCFYPIIRVTQLNKMTSYQCHSNVTLDKLAYAITYAISTRVDMYLRVSTL